MHLSVLLPFLMLTFLGRIFFALLQLQDHFAERLEIVLNFDSFEGFAKLVGKRHLKMMENFKVSKECSFLLLCLTLCYHFCRLSLQGDGT